MKPNSILHGTRNIGNIPLRIYLREPSVWIITAIAVVFVLLVVDDTRSLNTEYRLSQYALMQSEAMTISAEIGRLINERRRVVKALMHEKANELNELVHDPENEALIGTIRARLMDYFPELFAFAVVTDTGEFVPDYLGEFIGDVCRTEVHNLILSGSDEYKPWIHPQAGNYHYDLMVQRGGGNGLFFISFHPDDLVSILNNAQRPGYPAYLLRSDTHGLIEVSAAGSREKLQREIKLDISEQGRMSVDIPIEGTRWSVAIVPDQVFIAEKISQNWIRAIKISGALLLFWTVAIVIMFFAQHQRETARRELARVASSDALTGAASRWYFMERSQHVFADAKRYERPVSLIFIDADNFKSINDTYGHATGDRVLKTLSDLCRQHSRETDIFGRIGGEEFAITLANTTIAGAVLIAERLRMALASQVVSALDGTSLSFTVSMGVAECSQVVQDLEAVMRLADNALYQAKSSGRNCVKKAP